MLKEFKNFALRGNVIDLAVGVIIAGAFGLIINSLVNDVLTPLILKPALEAANLKKIEELSFGNGVMYGKFLSTTINFVIIAFVLFIIIRGINRMRTKEEVPAAPPQDITLLTEIRDLLKK